ncbi:HEAT repeats containing protein [Halapricum desulfuricans]|uniref:HEAT repeats containing protein n=1 Tax=Halapricum desulfuricans TaxID=2841257 RepID=A0A897NFR1_9EURY|nr:HEAT repeat domain-containing protein [Halapricum desulfuricans]QSG11537.1 HEAT repeats containing protein [Halapricum desulfuricans]
MWVFAFDRDWTVDVNPHPQHEAVPLEWVRHLAHETDHAVYAIGNQDLAEEAAIPGVVDIVGRHADDWQHYHAREFVPAVRDRHLDLSLPLVDQASDDNLVTDGGLPTVAGIMPADADQLASFLGKYDDTPGFEITYERDGDDVTQLCWNVTVVEESTGGAEPVVRCSALVPEGESVTVSAAAVDVVHAVTLSAEAVTAQAETQPDAAAALRRLADTAPNQLRLSPVLALLDQQPLPPEQQRDALHALAALAAVRPAACTPAIPILRSLLRKDDPAGLHDALATLHAIGSTSPEDIAPAVADIEPYLDSDRPSVRREAAGCLVAIPREVPSDIVDAVPSLVALLDEGAEQRQHAVSALAAVATEVPEATEAAAGSLADIALDESEPDHVRLSAIAALGRTVRASSALVIDVFEDIVELYDADNYKLRNNAVALTYEVADLHTDVVEGYVDDIAALLTVDDARTRINASGTLARVAKDFPASVDPLTPTFIDLLSDDNEMVRENACWVLGRLEASEAKATLEERLQEEPNETVRNRIAWALAEIDPV